MFIFLGLYGLLSFYFGFRTITALRLPETLALIAALGVVLLALALPLTWLLRDRLPGSVSDAMHMAGGYYAIWMLWGVLLFLGVDLVRLTSVFSGGWFPSEWQRPVAAGGLALMAIATVVGTISAAQAPRIRPVTIAVEGLPVEYDGLTIAHISDTHIGPLRQGDWTAELVRLVNSLGADLIVLTGDQADGDPELFDGGADPLGELRAPCGVIGVNGNHEHFGGYEEGLPVATRRLQELGITMLVNQWVEVAPGLMVAGVDDPAAGRHGAGGPDVRAALAGVPDSAFVIMLAHQPQLFDQIASAGVPVTLSGHTHGGQIFPWNVFVKLALNYVSGTYVKEIDGDTHHLFVSNGAATWGAPMRLGPPHEIPLLTLRRAGNPSERSRREGGRASKRLGMRRSEAISAISSRVHQPSNPKPARTRRRDGTLAERSDL